MASLVGWISELVAEKANREDVALTSGDVDLDPWGGWCVASSGHAAPNL